MIVQDILFTVLMNVTQRRQCLVKKWMHAHIKNDCPLEPVACELCWAGCTARPQRKDIEQHKTSNQIQHLTLLAKACRKLSKTCEDLKKENAELKGIISRNESQ